MPRTTASRTSRTALGHFTAARTRTADVCRDLQKLSRLILTNNQCVVDWPACADVPSLTSLPESIGRLVQLRELSLYCNDLVAVPESMSECVAGTVSRRDACRLSNLRVLYLGQNRRLAALPQHIGRLAKLTDLDASGAPPPRLPHQCAAECCLSAVPESILQCGRLQRLWLSENRIARLPEALGQMRSLSELFLQARRAAHVPPLTAAEQPAADPAGCTAAAQGASGTSRVVMPVTVAAVQLQRAEQSADRARRGAAVRCAPWLRDGPSRGAAIQSQPVLEDTLVELCGRFVLQRGVEWQSCELPPAVVRRRHPCRRSCLAAAVAARSAPLCTLRRADCAVRRGVCALRGHLLLPPRAAALPHLQPAPCRVCAPHIPHSLIPAASRRARPTWR